MILSVLVPALEDLEMYDERYVTTAFEMLIMQRIAKISWGYSRKSFAMFSNECR